MSQALPLHTPRGATGIGEQDFDGVIFCISQRRWTTDHTGSPPDPKLLRRADAKEAGIGATWHLSDAERDHTCVERADQTVTWDLASGSLHADVKPGTRRVFAEHSRDPGRGKLEPLSASPWRGRR
jgi:hypothetical protein